MLRVFEMSYDPGPHFVVIAAAVEERMVKKNEANRNENEAVLRQK